MSPYDQTLRKLRAAGALQLLAQLGSQAGAQQQGLGQRGQRARQLLWAAARPGAQPWGLG